VSQAIDARTVSSPDELNRFKMRLARELLLSEAPSNPDLLMWTKNPSSRTRALLSIKPVRTASGVAPLAIMTKPIDCRHGTCIFCPGGEKSVFGSIPKSYTGNEPASMRAVSNHFDAFLQTFNRLSQLVSTGHSVSKVELILMGGTFPSFDRTYQDSFVAETFLALNTFSDWFFPASQFDLGAFLDFSAKFGDKPNAENGLALTRMQDYLLEFKNKSRFDLESEQHKNESSNARCVAFCIETKPDYCKQPHIDQMMRLGCTRVELGVQCLNDEILSFVNRGHTLADTIEATRLLKDSSLKVTYHMMPGLPGSNPDMDVAMFEELFSNPDFAPDALKIYPCMVLPGTPLHQLYERREFEPLSTQSAMEIIAKAKRFFPPWVRVQRVMRDIPTKLSKGGVRSNNLRQLVLDRASELGIECQCIRCREVGHSKNGLSARFESRTLRIQTYGASQGTEIFISSEDVSENVLFGFCRLRMAHLPFRPELDSRTALVRELHVFGKALSVGESDVHSVQHHGLGRELLDKAEQIAKEKFAMNRIAVISGIGVRDYYRKLGYSQSGVFMVKNL